MVTKTENDTREAQTRNTALLWDALLNAGDRCEINQIAAGSVREISDAHEPE